MKTALKHIIVFLWAGFFLTAGLGFNIEKYCCNFCANEGPENIAKQLCKMAKSPVSNDCLFGQQEVPCCSLNRYQVDIPILQSTSATTCFEPPLPIYFSISTYCYSDKLIFKQVVFHPPPNEPTLDSGRKILAFKSVLLI